MKFLWDQLSSERSTMDLKNVNLKNRKKKRRLNFEVLLINRFYENRFSQFAI